MKCRKFAAMMTKEGHEVVTYGGPRADADWHEHVAVVSDEDRSEWFPGYDPETTVWDGFQADAKHWRIFNARTAAAIRERQQPDDILCVIAGLCQKELADQFPEMLPVEFGIGYSGVFAEHRVYESYAWQSFLAAKSPTDDVRYFDQVIPNYFPADDFAVRTQGAGEYLLFLGRMTPRKGLAVVGEIAARTDLPVVTAGQGSERVPECEHMGVVRGQQKRDLLAGARALLCPTTYLEPFGGVAVEAMMSGTPAIATDYGAFSETIDHGETGFRCRTLRQFMDAVEQVGDLDRARIREHALRYSTDAIAPQYTAYFETVASRRGAGWYAL